MARLEFVDGWWFVLTPVAYEFPNGGSSPPDSGPDYDANWLRIDFSTEVDGRRWDVKRHSWFLTWELNYLVRWCREVAAGTAPRSDFETIEPHLILKWVLEEGQAARLDVEFGSKEGPDWWVWDQPGWHRPATMEHDVTRNRLAEFADALERELQPFPVR